MEKDQILNELEFLHKQLKVLNKRQDDIMAVLKLSMNVLEFSAEALNVIKAEITSLKKGEDSSNIITPGKLM